MNITPKIIDNHVHIDGLKPLDTRSVEALIAALADLRRHMHPEVPHTRPVTDDPRATPVAIQKDTNLIAKPLRQGGVRLWLLSGGYGWLGFELSERNAKALRNLLIRVYPTGQEDAAGQLFGDQVGDGSAH